MAAFRRGPQGPAVQDSSTGLRLSPHGQAIVNSESSVPAALARPSEDFPYKLSVAAFVPGINPAWSHALGPHRPQNSVSWADHWRRASCPSSRASAPSPAKAHYAEAGFVKVDNPCFSALPSMLSAEVQAELVLKIHWMHG